MKVTYSLERKEREVNVRIEDIEHKRRVIAYCKRHLAQEETAKKDRVARVTRT